MAISNNDGLLCLGLPANNINIPFEHDLISTTTDTFEDFAESADIFLTTLLLYPQPHRYRFLSNSTLKKSSGLRTLF